jgi:hypothetical protein
MVNVKMWECGDVGNRRDKGTGMNRKSGKLKASIQMFNAQL